MVIVTAPAVYHNKEMDLSGGNGSFNEEYEYDYKMIDDDDQHYDYAELQKSLKIVFLLIYSLVFVLGVLGNGVVIWVTGFKIKKTVNTVLYLNLAVADFLVTSFLPLRIIHTALDDHWPFGKFMCKMDATVFFMSMYASIHILMVISVHRCVCVVCPVWAQNHRSVRKASCVILGVWVLGLAFSSPYFIFKDTQPSFLGKDVIKCYNNLASTDSTTEVIQLWTFLYKVMLITHFLMGFVLPFTVIVSCYSVIIYRLRNNRSLASQSGRPFKIIVTVITTFVLCWAPFHVVYLIKYFHSITVGGVVTIGMCITTCLAFLNSCLNPLLYVFMGQDFKDVFHSSIPKVLEEAFIEELPRTNTSTNPGSTSQETASSLNVL